MEPPSMMAVPRPGKKRPARAGAAAVDRSHAKDRAWEKIKFGDVVITAQRPSEADIQRNVEEGWAGLARALPRLRRAGVRIHPKKDVPLYWADADDPNVFIRKLNGKIERGVLEDGKFKATE